VAARLTAIESPAFAARRQSRAAESGEDQSPIVYARGAGSNVWDVDGNRYVDLTAGFGALLLGHQHPAVKAAVAAQNDTLALALGDVYGSDVKADLGEALVALFPAPGARMMFGLSGADAVTAALKTAALVTGRSAIVAFRGAYHGLSHGPLAACGLNEGFRRPFLGQLGIKATFAPYPASAAELDETILHVEAALVSGTIGAILVEPILGRGGCVVPPPEFLPRLRALCDRAGALLVVDEIWTGLGRAGAMLACGEAGIVPDLLCLGKGLGGGLPISACIGTAQVMAAWADHGGTAIHTATHFGNPLACAAALATLETLRERDLAVRARYVGARFVERLERALGAEGRVVGRGLMIGVELADAGAALAAARKLLARGYVVLTGGVAGNVLTLTPPLEIEEPLLDGFADALREVV
jgi:4-aminobutyrate aminotransferase/(S)-3-amino-2-methylpropionate transaminase